MLSVLLRLLFDPNLELVDTVQSAGGSVSVYRQMVPYDASDGFIPSFEYAVVRDRQGREVGRLSGSLFDRVAVEPTDDFDGDGACEVVVKDVDSLADGSVGWICVYSIGKTPRNLLAIAWDSYGKFLDWGYRVDHDRTGRPLFVSEINEYSGWIGPRGGSPVPIVLAFSGGRLVDVTAQHPQALDEWTTLARKGIYGERPASAVSYDDFRQEALSALVEYQCRRLKGEGLAGIWKAIGAEYNPQALEFLKLNRTEFDAVLRDRSGRVRYLSPHDALPAEMYRDFGNYPPQPTIPDSVCTGN